MSDNSVNKELKLFVEKICPDANNNICQKLNDLGVEAVSDLQYVTPDDLKDVMKPVHVRKMLGSLDKTDVTKPSDDQSGRKEILVVKPLPVPGIGSNASLSGFNIRTLLKTMPEIQTEIENGRRLPVEVRRKFIREVVFAVRTITEHCSKKEFEKIAQTVVSLYPDTFEDRIGELRVGTGYDSVMKQLIARNENLNRTPSNSNRNKEVTGTAEQTLPVNKKRKPVETDTYGCVNWGPKLSKTEIESQETIRKELQQMYGIVDGNWQKVYEGMEHSYGLLRQNINEGNSIEQLLTDWPFCMETNVVNKHCELLLGIKVTDTIESAYMKKAPILLRYFKSKQLDLGMTENLSQLEEEKGNENYQAILQGVTLCIQKWFGVDGQSLVFHVDEMSSNEEIEEANTKSWPRLAMLGASNLAAKAFVLLVDKRVVGRYPSFLTAISMLFSAYYMMNIEYPKDAAATLEFIQRCFVGINPDKGVKTNKKKKSSLVDARVLKFINELSDFQWRE